MFNVLGSILRSYLPGQQTLTLKQAMLYNHNKRTIINDLLVPKNTHFADVEVNLHDNVIVSIAKIPGGYLIKPTVRHYKWQFLDSAQVILDIHRVGIFFYPQCNNSLFNAFNAYERNVRADPSFITMT